MDSELASHAKEGFDKVVDHMVMKNLAKGVDLSSLGVTAASATVSNNVPSVGGIDQSRER